MRCPNTALAERIARVLSSDSGRDTCPSSLLRAVINEVLDDAYEELLRPHPGSSLVPRWCSLEEVVRQAATSFMYAPGIPINQHGFGYEYLFERLDLISSMLYEGTTGTGRLLLAQPEGGAVNMLLRFTEPVSISAPRWSRKLLKIASSGASLIADGEKI